MYLDDTFGFERVLSLSLSGKFWLRPKFTLSKGSAKSYYFLA